jgi:hypothetical protein
MAPLIVLLATLAHPPETLLQVPQSRLPLTSLGTDHAWGLLVNCTTGSGPDTPPNRARPTIVIAHGINPFHPVLHFALAQRYGEAIGNSWGPTFNVLSWDWNAATLHGIHPARNRAQAQRQGRDLGEALLQARIAPESLHLVGHSSGCVVVAAAARTIIDRTGISVHRLTLLDPAASQHALIFGALRAGSAGGIVEHFWATGPSGFGRPVDYANVTDRSFSGPAGWRGFFFPDQLDHLHIVRWHIKQMALKPWIP